MYSELRQAFRALTFSPAFSALVVLTLALGIGANSAVFTVVHGILLRPLPFPEPDRLVAVFEANERYPRMRVSVPNFRDWHERSRSFEGLAAYEGSETTVLGGNEPVVAATYRVSIDFFRTLGVPALLGRTFSREESVLGGAPAVVVSHRFWHQVLGGTRDLGSMRVRIGASSCRVVGVMPPHFDFPAGAELWLPSERERDDSGRTSHNSRVVGRLGPGVTPDAARAEMNAIAANLHREHAGDNDARVVTIADLRDQTVRDVRPMLLLLQAIVALVLLGACANVASALVTRGADRRREIAIRSALGAGRWAIVRQLLGESVVLALCGGVAGLIVAALLGRAFRDLAPETLPRLAEVGLDLQVVAFALVLSALTALLFGLLPSLQAARTDLRDVIAAGSRLAATRERTRARNALVGVEIAVALLLLVGAGLLTRSLIRLARVDPGFDPTGTIVASTTVPGAKYAEDSAAAAFYRDVLERAVDLPGVAALGLTSALPFSGIDPNGGLEIEGRPAAAGSDWQKGPVAAYRVVNGGYFSAMGIPLSRGRTFSASDDEAASPVAVVNEAMARTYWPGDDPIGRRLRFFGMDSAHDPWLTIVGVVGDVRHEGLDTAAEPEVYVHYLQLPMRTKYPMALLARGTDPDAVSALIPALREVVRGRDPEVPLVFRTLEDTVAASLGDRRFLLALVAGFTLIALTLAITGVYQVVAHSVAQRTPEIGVRVALGANPMGVIGLVMRGALPAIGGGMAAGLGLALVASGVLRSFLFDVKPTDPGTLAMVLALVAAVAALAALVPARRATRIDVVAALQRQ